MKRTLLVAAALALTATSAFAQEMPPLPDATLGKQVYLREGRASTSTETTGLVDLITRALDRSRILHLVPAIMDPDDTIEVEAPQTFVKSADGKRVTVTYEVTPPRGESGGGRTFTTTCAITQLDRCADAIAQRAERIAREFSNDGL